MNSFDDAIKEAENDAASQDDEPSDAGSSSDQADEPSDAGSSSDQADGPAGGDEANDLGPCGVIDADTIELDVINNSSKQSSYIIDVNFLNDAGERVSDESFFVNDVRPGEHAIEESFAFSLDGAAQCEIAEVERIASESPDDVSEVTCTITGLDFADDVTTDLVATNGSSGLSDYSINFAVLRDGFRTGTGFATIENVRAGESAPGQGFSFASGPAEGATCEVVSVTRTAS